MNKKKNGGMKNTLYYVLLVLAMAMLVFFVFGDKNGPGSDVTYSQFSEQLKDGKVKEMDIQPTNGAYKITGTYYEKQKVDNKGLSVFGSTNTPNDNFTTTVLPNDATLAEITKNASSSKTKVHIKEQSSNGMWVSVLFSFLPLVLMVFLFYMMMGQGQQGGGGGRVMNFGKSKAKEADKKANKVRFSDVAGAEEEKQELVEVVEFLKDPRRFVELGARIPAGVLLEGPPGTGKTLLAKAVAGEAGVPFYSISGSDFVEMFVGVGASRVRDLFENAKKTAPAIIFIDEIDAVGRQRGAGLGGGNDEREQTLNQLLVEMDGFQDDGNSVIVIAATNRSDVLDPALLRPGRFDRKVLVGAPDVKGREAVLKVHAKNKPLASDVDLHNVATQTPGYVGADLENVLNEAALVAARQNKKEINAADIDEGMDRAMAGPAKKDRIQSMREREIVAYHEAGHAIVGLVLENGSTVRKVTVVPRGRIGGYMLALPDEEIMQPTNFHLQDQLASLMGGRLGEEIVFGVATPGASNDIEKATHIARSMVTEYGMSKKLGMVSYEGDHQVFIGRDYGQTKTYSEATAVMIDDEVRRILGEAYDRAKEAIETHREQHKAIAEALLKYETLDAKQIMSLFKTGKMPDEAAAAEVPEPKTFEESLKDANANVDDFSNINIYNGDEKTDSKPEENKEKSEDETAE